MWAAVGVGGRTHTYPMQPPRACAPTEPTEVLPFGAATVFLENLLGAHVG